MEGGERPLIPGKLRAFFTFFSMTSGGVPASSPSCPGEPPGLLQPLPAAHQLASKSSPSWPRCAASGAGNLGCPGHVRSTQGCPGHVRNTKPKPAGSWICTCMRQASVEESRKSDFKRAYIDVSFATLSSAQWSHRGAMVHLSRAIPRVADH